MYQVQSTASPLGGESRQVGYDLPTAKLADFSIQAAIRYPRVWPGCGRGKSQIRCAASSTFSPVFRKAQILSKRLKQMAPRTTSQVLGYQVTPALVNKYPVTECVLPRWRISGPTPVGTYIIRDRVADREYCVYTPVRCEQFANGSVAGRWYVEEWNATNRRPIDEAYRTMPDAVQSIMLCALRRTNVDLAM
jgi:hypothetical protein